MKVSSRLAVPHLIAVIALALGLGSCSESSTNSGNPDPAIIGRVLDGEGEPLEDVRINLMFRVPDYFPWDFPRGENTQQATGGLAGRQLETRLFHNFPNPFNPATSIAYQLPVPSHVRLRILDYFGIELRTLVDGMQPAGNHQIIWDARDDDGQFLTNGYYRARLEILGEEDVVLETHATDGIFHASAPNFFYQTARVMTNSEGRFEILLEDLPIGKIFPMLSDSPVDTLEMITVGDTLRVYAQLSGTGADQAYMEIGLGDLDENVSVELTLP